jgi:hypothetical protein
MSAILPAAEAVDNSTRPGYAYDMESFGAPDDGCPKPPLQERWPVRPIAELFSRVFSAVVAGTHKGVSAERQSPAAHVNSPGKLPRGVVQYDQPAGPLSLDELTRRHDEMVRQATREALERERQRNSLHVPGHSQPLRLGPQAVEAPGIWLADPRALLPKEEQPEKLNSRDDPEWMNTLRSMSENREARRQES